MKKSDITVRKKDQVVLCMTFVLLCASATASAQEDSRNYVETKQMISADESKSIDKITYYDGLGRQTIIQQKGITPKGQSLFSLTEYDAAGRADREWLPVPGQSFLTEGDIPSGALAFYGNSEKPYSRKDYYSSSLGRVRTTYSPGASWMDKKGVGTEYDTNTANTVKLYTVSDDGSFSEQGFYAAGSLSKVTVTNEDGKDVITYSDNFGRKVLVERGSGNDTYFVYDQNGNLVYVLQPEYQHSGNLNQHAFVYRYDGLHHCIMKTLPGGGSVSYVYDLAGRLIFSQDSRQKTHGERTFCVYDSNGRKVLEGICNDATSLDNVRNLVVTTNSIFSGQSGYFKTGYSYGNVSITPKQLLNAYYYDAYAFRNIGGFSGDSFFPAATGYASAGGLLTAQISGVQGASSADTYEYSACYYDGLGNLMHSAKKNYDDSHETLDMTYSFSKKITSVSHTVIPKSGQSYTEVSDYSYDNGDRPVTFTHKIGTGGNVTIASNSYDELCRLSSNMRNGNSKLNTSYGYNIRNQTTDISSSLFTENLSYEKPLKSGTEPQYSGNISCMQWTSLSHPGIQNFSYAYDDLDRLLGAHYTCNTGTEGDGRYDEVMNYDDNGNILSLERSGNVDEGSYGVLDKLSLAYEGNRLMSVSDDADSEPTYQDAFHYQDNSSSAGEFAYDENGNMTKYLDKNISKIEYNCLNLPLKVTFTDGSTINYVYNAMGQKLSSTARINKLAAMMPITTVMQGNNDRSGLITTVTTYRGNFIYVDGKLSMVLFSGGYVDMTGGSPKYRYYLQDHLGSTRVVADANANVLQENAYYALGGLMSDQCVNLGAQPYKYNGKELNRMHGMDFYDYGARWYDAAIGRWTAVDPLTEKYYDISSYVYCGDNPINAIDPDGKKIVLANGSSQEFKDQYTLSMTYLKAHDCNSQIEYLENSETVITITETKDKRNWTESDDNIQGIAWNPHEGLLTNDSPNKLSPAILLFHEICHEKHKLENPNKFKEDNKNDDSIFQSKEETEVIKEETEAAQKCGEIPKGTKSRTDHGGVKFKTTNSVSREITNKDDPDVNMWMQCWEYDENGNNK